MIVPICSRVWSALNKSDIWLHFPVFSRSWPRQNGNPQMTRSTSCPLNDHQIKSGKSDVHYGMNILCKPVVFNILQHSQLAYWDALHISGTPEARGRALPSSLYFCSSSTNLQNPQIHYPCGFHTTRFHENMSQTFTADTRFQDETASNVSLKRGSRWWPKSLPLQSLTSPQLLLRFAQAFLDCQFQWEISFQQITWQRWANLNNSNDRPPWNFISDSGMTLLHICPRVRSNMHNAHSRFWLIFAKMCFVF